MICSNLLILIGRRVQAVSVSLERAETLALVNFLQRLSEDIFVVPALGLNAIAQLSNLRSTKVVGTKENFGGLVLFRRKWPGDFGVTASLVFVMKVGVIDFV